jgi:PKHD-type hydroxylase
LYLAIGDVLDAELLAACRAALADPGVYEDGRRTAGWHARTGKRNLQVKAEAAAPLLARVERALAAHPVLRAAAWPARFVRLLASRYEPGMAYGPHVDDALMGEVRCDLSFTLFLSDPESYEGGELVVDEPSGERSFKLPAGELILYPSSTLHRVAPVQSGTRLAIVGWIRSHVREADRRAVLFDLENVAQTLFAREGKSALFDVVAKTRSNLLRMWADG